MSTPSRRLSPSRCSVNGTTVTPRTAARAGGRSAVESVTMATPRAVKCSRRASRGNDLDFDRLLNLHVSVEQHFLYRAQKEKQREDEERGEDRRHVEAETNGHPDRRHHPDRRSRRE